jgi:hypothetical protein
MSDAFVRSGALQIVAFLAAVVVVNLLAMAEPGSGRTLGGAAVVAIYTLVFLLPFFLIDLFVVRPALLGRTPLPVVLAVELALLIALQLLMRWRGLAASTGPESIGIALRAVGQSVVFLLVYAACSWLINRTNTHVAGGA